MPGASIQVVVVLFALFGIPRLMAYIPDFDPLMMIVGVFVIVAVLQQVGFQMSDQPGADGERTSRQSRARSHANHRDGDGSAGEPRAEDLLKEAERCLEQNNWARLQELAIKVTGLDAENARAWELLATAQKWEGKREEAAATVKKAQEIYEVDSKVLRALAKELSGSEQPGAMAAECEAKAEDFFSRRQYDLAAECYTKAVDALTEEASADSGGDADRKAPLLRLRRRRAECAQQLQDWSTCRSDATVLLQEDPRDARALLQRAAANEALENFAAALEDARQLRAIDPRNSAANRIVHNCQQAVRS